jgi:hypothetical protein
MLCPRFYCRLRLGGRPHLHRVHVGLVCALLSASHPKFDEFIPRNRSDRLDLQPEVRRQDKGGDTRSAHLPKSKKENLMRARTSRYHRAPNRAELFAI